MTPALPVAPDVRLAVVSKGTRTVAIRPVQPLNDPTLVCGRVSPFGRTIEVDQPLALDLVTNSVDPRRDDRWAPTEAGAIVPDDLLQTWDGRDHGLCRRS